jgi:NADPH:quinone reductase-like Zn-dependent oxidoreductase
MYSRKKSFGAFMNAAVVHAFTAPPLHTTFADPIAAEGEQLVTVSAAALHQIVKSLANGTHYGSTGEFPFIPGVDGVGRLQHAAGQLPAGTRVYFGAARPPFGTFAEQSLAASWMTIPLPDSIDDATAAGIANPAMSSWVALSARAKFVPGESVLILGATGVSGKLAIQIAKRRGASRVIAVGRNPHALAKLQSLGADTAISLDQPTESLVAAFRAELNAGIDIVLDYLWGAPAEALLQAISKKGLKTSSSRVRYVQIGSTAGHAITLHAATLRSSGLELIGSGFGSASMDQIRQGITEFFALIAKDPIQFKVKTAKLQDVEALWNSPEQGVRLVFQP